MREGKNANEYKGQAQAMFRHFEGMFQSTESSILTIETAHSDQRQPLLTIKLDALNWKYFMVTDWECNKFDLLIEPGDIVRVSEDGKVICSDGTLRMLMYGLKMNQEARKGSGNGNKNESSGS